MTFDADSNSLAAICVVVRLMGALRDKGILSNQDVADALNAAVNDVGNAPQGPAAAAVIRTMLGSKS